MAKISHLGQGSLNWRAVLAQILEREGVDAIVVAVRTDGVWATTWAGENFSAGSLSMAALKVLHDVMEDNEDRTSISTLERPPHG